MTLSVPLSFHRDVLGQFDNAETGASFCYASRPADTGTFAPDHQHIIFVGPHADIRYATVLKARVRVVVDEAADGSPVVETWTIKRHRQFQPVGGRA